MNVEIKIGKEATKELTKHNISGVKNPQQKIKKRPNLSLFRRKKTQIKIKS